jgi:hypothetical protein
VFWDVTSWGLLYETDVSEELIASFIRATRIGELGTLAVISNPFLQEPHGVTPPEDGILHSHRREYLKSYVDMHPAYNFVF